MATKVGVDFEGKDNASRMLQNASARLAELRAEIERVNAKGQINLTVADTRNLSRLTSEAGRLEKALESVEGQGAQTAQGLAQSFGGELQGVLGGLGLGNLAGLATGAGIAAAAVGLAKVTGEAAQLGAQSLDTKRSFDSVMRSVGQGPALLGRLDQAAGGTITQLRLMQLTNTALAGSSAQFGTAFASALPKLIEGARAASQLNPELGNAEFLFQSLVTGIKRGSPMLIDNTGITLNLTEANERYAQSVGKAANELTEEEKKLALIDATLGGVDRLVQQAGGNLDNMTSKQQQMKVATEELKTALGELVARPYTVVVQQVTKGVSGAAEATQRMSAAQTANNGAAPTEERLAAIDERIQQLKGDLEALDLPPNLVTTTEREIDRLEALAQNVQRYGTATDEVRSKLDAYLGANQKVAAAQDGLNSAVKMGDEAQIGYWQSTLRAAEELRAQSLAAYQAAEGVAASAQAAREAAKDYDNASASMLGLNSAMSIAPKAALPPSKTRWGLYGDWARPRQDSGAGDLVGDWLARQTTAHKTAARDFGTQYKQAAQQLGRDIEGCLSQAAANSRGLFDVSGGKNDPNAPGANGAFENLYRAADVAKNGSASPWAKALGLDQESAKKISQDFQNGIFSEGVTKLIDVDKLTAQIQGEQAAAESSAKFADYIAKKLGVDGAGQLVASKTFSAIAGGLAGGGDKQSQTDVAGQMIGFGKTAFSDFEKGFIEASAKTDAEALKTYGKSIYANVKTGFLEELGASTEFTNMAKRIFSALIEEEL